MIEGLTERPNIGQSANRTLSAPNEIPERMPSLDAQERRSGTTLVLVGLAVAIAYVGAAQLGFRLAYVAEQITTVWAPTGIALAALLLFGVRLWPAIWLGAFVANAGSEAPCGPRSSSPRVIRSKPSPQPGRSNTCAIFR